MKNKNGFTLIELLVVVLIIGILAAIAVPQYEMAVEKSRAAEAVINVKAMGEAFELYFLANGKYPTITEQYDQNALDSLDLEFKNTDDWSIITHKNAYVGFNRKGSSKFKYMISQTMKHNLREEWTTRGLTCSIWEMSDTDSPSARLCKIICGESQLKRVWGSGEFGCEIKS